MTTKELQDQQKEQLMEAYDRLNAKTAAEVRRNIYESLTYFWLHRAPPDSFAQAIHYAEEYISNPRFLPSAGIWANLACAYTQKAKRFIEQTGAQEVDAESKKRVLNAIDQALRLDETWQSEFESLLDTELKIFAEDDEIRARIGLPPKRRKPEQPSGDGVPAPGSTPAPAPTSEDAPQPQPATAEAPTVVAAPVPESAPASASKSEDADQPQSPGTGAASVVAASVPESAPASASKSEDTGQPQSPGSGAAGLTGG
jgi:hypothetical protein